MWWRRSNFNGATEYPAGICSTTGLGLGVIVGACSPSASPIKKGQQSWRVTVHHQVSAYSTHGGCVCRPQAVRSNQLELVVGDRPVLDRVLFVLADPACHLCDLSENEGLINGAAARRYRVICCSRRLSRCGGMSHQSMLVISLNYPEQQSIEAGLDPARSFNLGEKDNDNH